jgi:hypothetical protein
MIVAVVLLSPVAATYAYPPFPPNWATETLEPATRRALVVRASVVWFVIAGQLTLVDVLRVFTVGCTVTTFDVNAPARKFTCDVPGDEMIEVSTGLDPVLVEGSTT